MRCGNLGRFIPAWAGNSRRSRQRIVYVTVHPRVGGEQHRDSARASKHGGSSPRGRGTGWRRSGLWYQLRFIPAWAGNRRVGPPPHRDSAVHPRVGGEQPSRVVRSGDAGGSSPRGRGTAPRTASYPPAQRFIPAWAGNRLPRCGSWRLMPVHPRVGGEQRSSPRLASARNGSSPRGRGTGTMPAKDLRQLRFIPAWAGNSSSGCSNIVLSTVHPRVGGEQPRSTGSQFSASGSSPRGRGTGG